MQTASHRRKGASAWRANELALQASRIQLARLLEILVGLQRDSHFAIFALNPKNREENRIYISNSDP